MRCPRLCEILLWCGLPVVVRNIFLFLSEIFTLMFQVPPVCILMSFDYLIIYYILKTIGILTKKFSMKICEQLSE